MTEPTETPRQEDASGPDGPRGALDGAPSLAATLATSIAANASDDRPAIYVACLASYNAGILHGAWIWAENAEDMRDATRAMLAASPESGAEEWAIHDYAGFEGLRLSEYQSFETVADMAAFINEQGELGAKVAEYYGGDLDDARERLTEYRGQFESVADYARELVEECGPEIPEAFRHYIDWESMGRDMAINGEILTIEMGHARIHVFGGH